MLLDAAAGARMTVAEALTNLVFAPITHRKYEVLKTDVLVLQDIKCSGNWMWPAKLPGEGARLVQACSAMCALMCQLGVAIDGGKDSLSMAANVERTTVKAPGTLVISAYAPCTEIRSVVTPELKCPDGQGSLLYVPFGSSSNGGRLGGSALAQCWMQLGSEPADVDNPALLASAFDCTQQLIKEGLIIAGHDVSDGGLVTCVMEMAFAANCGIDVHIQNDTEDVFGVLFGEEAAIVVECRAECTERLVQRYEQAGVPVNHIGHSTAVYGPAANIAVSVNGAECVSGNVSEWRAVWEQTSTQLDMLQTDVQCVQDEQHFLATCQQLPIEVTFDGAFTGSVSVDTPLKDAPAVAIVRDEGSNGDREMAAAFYMAGFQVFDVHMQDLLTDAGLGAGSLAGFRGLAFVGGFSYADVLGSARGWAATIQFNDGCRRAFDAFAGRPDTFSLGVCNGCQLMAHIGWIGRTKSTLPDLQLDDGQAAQRRVCLEPNDCGRLQCYFNVVRVQPSSALMLRGMQGSTLGVWVSHGEGKFGYSSPSVLPALQADGQVPLVYVDHRGQPANTFPMNPNGSHMAVAGVCSPCGRHLALMPHPERSVLSWQCPVWPADWPSKTDTMGAPWLRMFTNAHDWCTADTSHEAQR